MKKQFLLLALVTGLFSGTAFCQLADSLKAQFVKDWERAKAYTDDYLAAMPADKYSYKPQDSVRSFAGQMLHLAGANFFFIGTVAGISMDPNENPEHRPGAQSKDSVTYFVNKSYDFAIETIKKMTPAQLEEKAKLGKMEAPKYVLLMKAFEHQTHHRGQSTIYIRMVGVKPPNERLF